MCLFGICILCHLSSSPQIKYLVFILMTPVKFWLIRTHVDAVLLSACHTVVVPSVESEKILMAKLYVPEFSVWKWIHCVCLFWYFYNICLEWLEFCCFIGISECFTSCSATAKQRCYQRKDIFCGSLVTAVDWLFIAFKNLWGVGNVVRFKCHWLKKICGLLFFFSLQS